MSQILYHYTDAAAYKAIIENPELDNEGKVLKVLRPSMQNLSGDAHYGDGWYFTDIPPFGGDRLKIARALWDGSYEKNYVKTEYFIACKVHGKTIIKEPRPHVFFIPIGSKSRPTFYAHGPIPQPEKFPYADTPHIAPQKRDTDILREQAHETSKHSSLFQRIKQWLGF